MPLLFYLGVVGLLAFLASSLHLFVPRFIHPHSIHFRQHKDFDVAFFLALCLGFICLFVSMFICSFVVHITHAKIITRLFVYTCNASAHMAFPVSYYMFTCYS